MKCLHICVQIHDFHKHFDKCFFEPTNWVVNFTAPGQLFQHNVVVNNMDASGKTCEEDVALHGIEHTQYQCHYAHCSFKLLMMSSVISRLQSHFSQSKTLGNVATESE